MCGILYKSRLYGGNDESLFISALRTIKHRGPDEEGILFTNKQIISYSFFIMPEDRIQVRWHKVQLRLQLCL